MRAGRTPAGVGPSYYDLYCALQVLPRNADWRQILAPDIAPEKYCKRCETTEERRARSVCARLYVVRPHQVFGAETAFAETACFIKVSALIR